MLPARCVWPPDGDAAKIVPAYGRTGGGKTDLALARPLLVREASPGCGATRYGRSEFALGPSGCRARGDLWLDRPQRPPTGRAPAMAKTVGISVSATGASGERAERGRLQFLEGIRPPRRYESPPHTDEVAVAVALGRQTTGSPDR